MNHKYKTRGTCAREITFELEDGIVKNVSFFGGCNGNLKGIAALVGGGGGGRPNMAQAGGKNPAGIAAAIAKVEEVLAEQI